MTSGAHTGARSRKLSENMVNRNAEVVRALVAKGGLEKLPVATDRARQIAEALMRRGVAATAQ